MFFIEYIWVGLDRATSGVTCKFLTTAQPKLADYFCGRLLNIRSDVQNKHLKKINPRLELGPLVLDSGI